MRYPLLALPLTALLLGACEGDPTSPPLAPTAPVRVPGVVHTGSGALVVREGIIIELLFGDPRTHLAMNVGLDTHLADWCRDPTIPVVVSPATAIGVLTPTGRGVVHTLSKEAYVDVFAIDQLALDQDEACQQVIEAPVVATGRVKFTTTLSDFEAVFINGTGGTGAGTLHATVQGIVDLTRGGQARLFGTVQVLMAPDGSLHMDEEHIRLTPL